MTLCLMLTLHNMYYAVLFVILLAAVAIRCTMRRDRQRELLAISGLIVVVALGCVLALAPSIWYTGLNSQQGVQRFGRTPAEVEDYGLTITQLLLPVTGHRISALELFKDRYNSQSSLVQFGNEKTTLGAVGVAGLLLLLTPIVQPSVLRRLPSFFSSISPLNFWAILIATMGGVGSLFTFVVSPMMRGYNRISVFIGFFCLLAVAGVLDALARRFPVLAGRRQYALCAGLLVFGIWDQTTARMVPDYEGIRQRRGQDRTFINRIEKELPNGAMVFQLPYLRFPENGPIFDMLDYSHARGYLHSRSLRWSYGALKWSSIFSSKDEPEDGGWGFLRSWGSFLVFWF